MNRVVGIGVDLASIRRVRAVLDRNGAAFLARIFTDEERQYALACKEPAHRLAARFAAKEAAIKALGGWGAGMTWKDMGVVRGDKGRPELVLLGGAGARARDLGVRTVYLSLSHEGDTAIAMVLLEG